jgi:hypothetical protein
VNFPTRIGTAIVPLVVLIGLVAPASAPADVRFGAALASSASEPGVNAQAPAVAGNAAGVVVAAYPQTAGAVYNTYARVKPAGTAAFGPPQSLTAASSDAPAAAVAPDGTITVAWQQASPCSGSSVWMATVPPGGAFGPKTKISDNAFFPKLAVAPDGTVVLVYDHDKGSCVHEERAQVRPRVGSPTDTVISDPAYGNTAGSDVAIAIDGSGTAIAAFVQSLNAAPYTRVLRVARRPSGGAWTGTTLNGPNTEGSALSVSPDGHAVVADNTASASGHAVEVRSLAPGASMFSAPQAVTDFSVNDTVSGVAVADGGAAVVTTASEKVAARAPGAGAFAKAAPIGLTGAANLLPVYTAKGELVLFDAEQLPGSSRFSLVARVQPTPGGALGAPQPTGLDSDLTSEATLAQFGANDIAAGWYHRPQGGSFQAGLALGDGTAPTLGALSAPSGGLAGTPLAFGATPSDNLGIAGVQWAFGDGAAAAGASTTHAFAAGASTWSATATDLVGHTSSASGGLAIQAQAQAQSQPQPAKLAVRITPPRRGTRARKLRTLQGTASGPVSRVEVAVVRVLRGAKGAPVATRTRAACSALGTNGRLARTLRRAGRAGCAPGRFLKASRTARWTLSLRHRLPAGSYLVFARARSASGATSPVARIALTLRK